MTVNPVPVLTRKAYLDLSWSSNEEAFYKCAIDYLASLSDCGVGRRKEWSTPRLNDGKHTFYLVAEDSVGNRAPSVSIMFTVGKCVYTISMCVILNLEVKHKIRLDQGLYVST